MAIGVILSFDCLLRIGVASRTQVNNVDALHERGVTEDVGLAS